jgi:AAA+ ATPase superfamily predicted ATPase
MFDRGFEWSELSRFVSYKGGEATLGVVSGRRRQGKTFLLDAVCRATGGFFFAASEATEAESLRQFGQALARFRGDRAPYHFQTWDEAVDVLMTIATDGPIPVVIDEFPFLVRASPELPSLLQRALGPQARDMATPVRLLLCGSALSFMGNLLSGTAPLRGRASLELVVPTLDYRLAAEFWGLTADPQLALLVNSVVGGTPAYHREFTLGDVPDGIADFDDWVVRNVLNPSRPLFREARFLLAEEPDLRDTALYHGVLSAIASGNHSRGGIANYLGRKSTDLGHSLTVLEDTGMVHRAPDAFHGKRSAYRIAEPIVAFYHGIMRPEWTDLERPGNAARVWQRSAQTFRSKIVGPHFEGVCRDWVRWYADPSSVGGHRTTVASAAVADPGLKQNHELDVVVFGRDDADRQTLLAIGEAKWGETMTSGHVERLRHIRRLLADRGVAGAANCRLLCFSGAGFANELLVAADNTGEIELVDGHRLYNGA